MSIRYVVVSPVRDEEKYLEETIRSMVRQTVRPVQWILVNDGSTDGTGDIIDRWASQFPWIRHLHQQGTRCRVPLPGRSRGIRAREAKEIEAFYTGYDQVTETDWDFLVKLDGDLGFEPDYFARCFAEFDRDPRLGVGGGLIYNLFEGELQVEATPSFHVRGATKIYRRRCWKDIGGVVRGPGWDTVDEVKANMLGWTSRSFTDLKVVHYRFTGSANGGWQNAVKNGVWSYVSGYHPLYMLFRCARRLVYRPYVTGSLGLLYGFLLGYLQRIPQIPDHGAILYLRGQQMRRLMLRPSIWK